MKEKSFKFRECYAKALSVMDDKQAGKFIKALTDFVFNGKRFESNDVALVGCYSLVSSILEQEQLDRENGRKGGIIATEKRKHEVGNILVVKTVVNTQEKQEQKG